MKVLQSLDVKKLRSFKDLFMEMYKNFPNGSLREDVVHKIIVKEIDREFLINHGFLIREKHIENGRDVWWYNLGPNGLLLINAWKMEKLTLIALGLTILTLILMIIEIANKLLI